MEDTKQDAVNELMKRLAQITTNLIDDVEAAFVECLQTLDIDPAEHADYVNAETHQALSDIANRAISQHHFRQMTRKYQIKGDTGGA